MEESRNEELLLLLAQCNYWRGKYEAVKQDYDDLVEKVIRDEPPYEEI